MRLIKHAVRERHQRHGIKGGFAIQGGGACQPSCQQPEKKRDKVREGESKREKLTERKQKVCANICQL